MIRWKAIKNTREKKLYLGFNQIRIIKYTNMYERKGRIPVIRYI